MMQLNVTPDFKKRSLKFKPEFPAAAKLESVELVIPNPDGEIKTAGLSFIIYSARCGSRKLAVCDAFTGTGTITGTLNLCTDRMVDEFYHLPLGTRRSFHAVLWSEADQWMIGAGRISIVNNPGSDSLNPAPLPADRYPTFEEVEEMIRNSGGLDEPVVRRVNGIAPDNAGNVSITIPGDVSELKDKDGLTLTAQQKNTLATLSTTYAAKNHTHSEYALKSELPDVSGFITSDKLNLYQLKADAFSGKYADLAGKPSAFPPASHTHAVADVNGLADELSRKLTVPAGGNAGQFLMKTVSGCGWSSIDLASYITITQARNEFAAKTHEHSQYALASALQDYAAKVHTHIIGDVTGLQDALDGKAAADHNHDSVYAPKEATAAALNAKLTIPAGGTAGQVIGKTSDGYGWITVSGGVSSWNDLTDKPSAFPPATHNHVIGDVTGLENKLSEKISSVNGQVPNSSGAVTLPVATSKADGLMSAADKEKLDGLDTTGSTGDMLKSVYDTDDDGIVDHAAAADAVGATTAAQVADAVGKAHTHANQATLDKLAETDGKLTFDGAEIGGSGTVKSVNGQLPDESGNVTVETGGVVDESRLLPTGGRNGNLLEYQEGADRGNNVNTKLLLQPATSDGLIVDQAAGNAAPVGITNSGNVAIAANALVFSGENALIIEPDTLGMTLGGNNEYSIEVDFQLDQVKSDWATLFGGDGNMTRSAFYINSSGATAVQGGIAPDTTGWTTGTRHRLTIERFQDGDSWKTVIYRNGAVLATSVTTPNTLSGDRFPIGSNLEGTGRNFVGKIWAFRISNKAEHRGVSFAPRELPFLPPAGQPVWVEGIDRSRLLPENPANGDIPCFDATATIGGGNDVNTKLLIQPETSNNQILDQAAGNAAPVTLENHNVTVDEEGNMVFDGSNAYLKIPANTLPSDFFNGTDEWTLDIVYNVASKDMQCLFGCSSSLRMDFLLNSGGTLQIGGGPNLGTGWPFNEDVHLTFEIYKDGASWKYTIFRNGSVVTTGTWVNADWRSVDQYIGWEGESDSRKINGKIKALRLTSGALHKGAAFQSDYPWTRPQTVGEWNAINTNEFVKTDSDRLLPENVVNGDIPCFDATATTGGGNDANTKILLHFDADEIKDEAAGNAAPVTIKKKSGTITVVEGGKWGKCAKYVAGGMTVATNLDELNANNWVVSGWFNPDENNHGVSYPVWLSMDDSSTNGFFFDSTGRYGESDGPLFYLDTPPASGTWHWLAIVKYSGGLRFYLNGAFLNEISAQQRANFCSTLAIGGFAGTHAEGDTERTFSGLVDEVRLQYIPDDEITQWTGTSIAVPDAPYSKPQTVGEWGKFNKSELKATRVRILSRDPSTRLVVVQPLRLRNGVWETDPNAPEKTVKY